MSESREAVEEGEEGARQTTLGNVRLRHPDTNELIRVPNPSRDPNDPLNWPQWYKYTIAVIVCIAMLCCNFLAAGPTVAIVQTTLDFFPDVLPAVDPTGFNNNVVKVAFFFTTTALLQGIGNFLWVPFANRYGRRPVYVASYTIYLASAIWAIFDHSFAGFLAARIFMGFGAGAAETIAPITISDVFFLHERGAVMSCYTSFLSIGVGFGLLISGFITKDKGWRVIYEVASGFIGFVLLMAFFAFPETAYLRDERSTQDARGHELGVLVPEASKDTEAHTDVERTPEPKSYVQKLRLYSGSYTNEPLGKLLFRPLGLILLPPVLWSALVESVTIGFLVAVTSNVSVAFEATYGFKSWQVGLCFISACIGSVIGIPAGGKFGDFVADRLTKKNHGRRTPEMRLPAMMPSLITTPLALILYGVGIQHKLHWMCPTVGLGLLNFSIVQGTNICLVYVIDAYRPVAGEVTLTVMGFKSLFGFLLSFYTNKWVASAGYQNAYGAMAGISAAIIVLWVPLYYFGERIRTATLKWSVGSFVRWDMDREVGE